MFDYRHTQLPLQFNFFFPGILSGSSETGNGIVATGENSQFIQRD